MLNGLYCAVEMVLSLCCFHREKVNQTDFKERYVPYKGNK